MSDSTYAIRNGRSFVAVHVSPEQAQCYAGMSSSARRRNGASQCFYRGTSATTIQRCATDPAVRKYPSLRMLREEYPEAERRADLDAR